MNYKHIRTILDQKDENGYPLTVTMFGVITEFKGEGVSKSGKQTKKVSIRDDSNETHNVTLRGTLPDYTLINQRAQFSLCSFGGTYQGQAYTGYSGFWDSRAQVQQQALSQPAGTSKKENVDWDAIAEGKVRHGLVCAYIESGREPDINVIKKWLKYIMKGEESPNLLPRDIVYSEPDNEPQPEDDEPLPF